MIVGTGERRPSACMGLHISDTQHQGAVPIGRHGCSLGAIRSAWAADLCHMSESRAPAESVRRVATCAGDRRRRARGPTTAVRPSADVCVEYVSKLA